MTTYRVSEDSLSAPAVIALLRDHLEDMHRWSPPGKVHAMPAERLREADVTFFAAWLGEELAAVGALKELDGLRGELKSMRAAGPFRGKGAGRAILERLLAEAKARGYAWVGLETGRTAAFEDAHRLYRAYGFRECAPFGSYASDDFSVCMSLSF